MMGRTLGDSIERGYERLHRAYDDLDDSLSSDVQGMYGAMGHMRGQMQRYGSQGMGRMGMRGRSMMRGQEGEAGGARWAQMQEWHQQMMAMHAEMAQLHQQRGHPEIADRHEQLSERHRRMMEAEQPSDETAPSQEDASVPEEVAVDGATLYRQQCASCHGRSGQGMGSFPPLSGASWVAGDADVPIRILLNGLEGRIEVQGRTYNGVMPAFGSRLRDDEIAAILTFVRSTWDNDAGSIEPDRVAGLRQQYGDRSQPWTSSAFQETEE